MRPIRAERAFDRSDDSPYTMDYGANAQASSVTLHFTRASAVTRRSGASTVQTMKVFVAGATGATGQVFVPMATEAGLDLVLHVRPQSAARSPLAKDPRARVIDLGDADGLAAALAGADAVVSFVGTMKSRFAAGDTYEASDVGSTRQIVLGAKSAGVPRVLLLSSYGAGGMGAYL